MDGGAALGECLTLIERKGVAPNGAPAVVLLILNVEKEKQRAENAPLTSFLCQYRQKPVSILYSGFFPWFSFISYTMHTCAPVCSDLID